MMNILVAEKQAETRGAIASALSRVESVAIDAAVCDLRAALDAITQNMPDLVISGVELEDASALDLVTAVRKVAPSTRIIVIGRVATREEWRTYLAAGADRFVEHDFELEELRQVVASLRPARPPALPDDELRLLGRIAAGVVHDLNNYLGVIDTALVLLARAHGDASLLAHARTGVGHASRLTETLLGYVRGEPVPFEQLDFGALVRRTVALLSRSLDRAIALRLEVAPKLPPVRGCAPELEQLVLNLVLNAADAMCGGGDLLIRVRAAGAAVYFEVSDTGTGLAGEPPRADAMTSFSTKTGRRAGLGLGISHRVVDRHGGKLILSPRRDRTGTIANVFLPVDTEAS